MEYRELEAMLRADEEKAAKFKQALEGAKDSGAQSDAEALAMAAMAIGCELTPEQIEQHLTSSADLDDDDLELVTGGVEDDWCVFSYNCFTALLHEEDSSSNAACWSDYTCVFVNHHYDR